LKKTIAMLILTVAGLCHYACHQDRKAVMLRLNYEPGMSYPYVITYKIIKRAFENDTIVADVSSEVIESGVSSHRLSLMAGAEKQGGYQNGH